ncbi:MAG: hypothetical protein KGH67_05000 [Candidatus Micrarchaeota archaeon]|nr:hypothetical protein [Candidatus Micrarchaeota archaeon]MDE1859858.1 hypothetical protein [Candidatus Micrarchaeota archaeon]
MAVSKTEMKTIERKLNKIEIEITKMRAVLLPTEKLSKKKLAELKKIEADMLKGNSVSARDLFKQLG